MQVDVVDDHLQRLPVHLVQQHCLFLGRLRQGTQAGRVLGDLFLAQLELRPVVAAEQVHVVDHLLLRGLRRWLRDLHLLLRSHYYYYGRGSEWVIVGVEYKVGRSKLVGLDELLAHAKEVVLLVSGLLHDVEEGVLHDDLSGLQELLVQQQVFVVRIVSLSLTLALQRNLHNPIPTLQPTPTGELESSMSTKGVSSLSIFSNSSSTSPSFKAALKMFSKTWSRRDLRGSARFSRGASLAVLSWVGKVVRRDWNSS
jgi:hypothetical protein